jgi:hypothetical protein
MKRKPTETLRTTLARVDKRLGRLVTLVGAMNLNDTTFAQSMKNAIEKVDALAAENAELRRRLGL